MNDHIENYSKIQEFIKEHLVECTGELIEMYETCVLPDGRIREASSMLKDVLHPSETLKNVIRIVERLSIEYVWSSK